MPANVFAKQARCSGAYPFAWLGVWTLCQPWRPVVEKCKPRHQSLFALPSMCCWLFFVLAASSAYAADIELGPRIERENQVRETAAAPRPQLDIPPLRLAIPVLNPGLPENQAVWDERGIWPELRRAEAVYCAARLADAARALGHFDSVIVTPDTSASADLYLLGTITISNGEDLGIKYRLLDATGKTWIQPKIAKYRVPLGWHENNTNLGADPFAGVYAAIANDVERSLVAQAKRHAATARQNAKRAAQGRSQKLSDLEKVTLTRELVLASYFAPDRYGGSLRESRNRIKIEYLPSMDDADWARFESVRIRDDAFSQRLAQQYAAFADEMQSSYALWQQDSFPYAREQRILRGRATAQGIFGALAAAATIAAAADGDVGTLPTVAAGVASTALIFSSFRTNNRRKDEVRQLNELSRSLQSELAPSVVELRETTVTLRGTAVEQFQQWRALLRDLYANATEDVEAVTIVQADNRAQSD